MHDLLPELCESLDKGHKVVLATVVQVVRSAPRGPGAAMMLDDQGKVTGSVSGGCVETDLYEQMQAVMHSGEPQLLEYGISDEQGFAVGLSCGGTIHIFVERLDERDAPILRAYETLIRENRPAALATALEGSMIGRKVLVTESDPSGEGSSIVATDAVDRSYGSETSAFNRKIATTAQSMFVDGRSSVVRIAEDEINEESTGSDHDAADKEQSKEKEDVAVFFAIHVPPPRLFVFGATNFASALCTAGKMVGYYVVACDARAPFATRERFPDADEVLCRWPHDVLAEAELGPRDAVCVLTHDTKFDIPALKVALNRPTGYVGALGSRRTQARRREALLEEGLTEEQLARIAAPIGLDIGAETPPEFAISVMAEIIARKRGRAGGSLSTSKERIHARP